MIPVLIQADCKGVRRRPFTTTLPKPPMTIGELPVIEIDLRVQHESEAIDDRFGASRRLARVA